MCPITDRRRTCLGPVQRPLINMADNSVSACMEQHVVMKFLVNEGIKPADIYRRLQAQYGDETLSHSKTFEWCKRFKDGHMSVSDNPGRGGSQATAVMASVFWDIIHVDFLPRGATINSEYYCHVLSDVHMRLRKKRPGLITKGILFLQDNVRAHTAHRTTCTLQQIG